MKRLFLLGVVVFGIGALIGCDSNPTNAPTKSAVADADKTRLEAIENDPSLTPEQKELQKRMLGLTPGGRGPAPTGKK